MLIPNNEMSAQRKDIDLEKTAATQASPDQGKTNGTGGTDSGLANDLRTDGITAEGLLDLMRDDRIRELIREVLDEKTE